MPLLRIETRSKNPAAAEPTARRPAAAAPPPSSSSAVPAIAAGVLLGVVVIAGVVAFAMGRKSVPPAPQQLSAQVAPTAVVSGTFGSAGSSLPPADTSLEPINQDYTRDTIVAVVNNVPFSMGQLETAVRIGRTLGSLSGDAVPDYGSPDMRTFQIEMLRRQVDVILMKQAFEARGLEDAAGLPMESLVSAYLERVGATQDDLAKKMADNGVTTEALQAWFADSQQVNLFVQEALMQGQDQSQRDQVTKAWLQQQWQSAQIYVNFYDPDSVASSPTSDASSPTSGAGTASAPIQAPLEATSAP
jgi:hypothetical protein